MSQSRKMSFLEQCISVGIGFGIALGIQAALMPALGIPTTTGQDLIVVAVFTVASVVRGYFVRRLFNWWHHRAIPCPRCGHAPCWNGRIIPGATVYQCPHPTPPPSK